jgi:hypothetical protein
LIKRVRTFTLLVAAGAVGTCGGEPNPTGPGGTNAEPEMTRVIKQDPTFREDVQEIFVRTGCTGSSCHGINQGGFTLLPDSPANYSNIVGVPAEDEPEFLLIKPFDATNSYIIIRLEDRQRVGIPMPIGRRLDSIDLANLRNWINLGAPNN